MSVSYSSLPTHHLQIGRSRLRYRYCLALASATALALAHIAAKGQIGVAMVLTGFSVLALRKLFTNDGRGYRISWRAGSWQLHIANSVLPVQVQAFNINFSRVVYVAFRHISGPRGRGVRSFWIFADSVGAQEYRCLRAQLTLTAR